MIYFVNCEIRCLCIKRNEINPPTPAGVSHAKRILQIPKEIYFVKKSTRKRKCFFLSMSYKKDIFAVFADTFTSSLFTITYYLIDKFRKRRVKSEELIVKK